MDIAAALNGAMREEQWNPTRIAFESGVGELQARKWLRGDAIPSGLSLERLRAKMPSLCRRLNEQHAQIAGQTYAA